jgi:hypothetical protein
MFVVFLLLFSYLLLCDFHPITQVLEDGTEIGEGLTWLEIILILWVLVFAVDEVKGVTKIII